MNQSSSSEVKKRAVVFPLAVQIKTHDSLQAEEVEQAAAQALQEGLTGEFAVQQVGLSVDDQPELLEESDLASWSGQTQIVVSSESLDTQDLMNIENSLCGSEIKDSSGACLEITLVPVPGNMPKAVEEQEDVAFLKSAFRTVGEMISESANRRPAGWYAHPDGGYRYWSGYDWQGDSIDNPPHTHH